MEPFDSLCKFNPTAEDLEPDPMQDCGLAARWHVMPAEKPAEGERPMYQACDSHLGSAMQMSDNALYHEFGSACGLPESWWDIGHNTCVTAETGVEIGLLEYADGL